MNNAGMALASVVCLFLFSSPACAWDWKQLHEEAGRGVLSEERAKELASSGSAAELYKLGLVKLNLYKDREAGEIFAQLRVLVPEEAGPQWGAAEVMRRQHRLGESEELLSRIIKAVPGFSPAYISLAYIKHIRQDFNGSVRSALYVLEQGRENVDLDNYVRAHLIYAGSKGMIAHYGGPLSKAINGTAVYPHLKKAESLQPDSPGVFFGLGVFYFLAPAVIGGNKEKAMSYLQKAIEADPFLADAYVRLAQVYLSKGDREKYNFYLSQALKIDPQNELAIDIKSGKCRFICTAGEGQD